MKHYDKLPVEHLSIYNKTELENKEMVVTDYIAGTTDNYIISLFEEIFIPCSEVVGFG